MARRGRPADITDQHVVPVVEETASVRKERVVTGSVRVHKRVQEREEVLDVALEGEAFEVTRVRLDRWVEAAPPVRMDGDTTVYPVLEEVLVVEKRLRLVEEVRVTRRRTTRQTRETIGLRRVQISVERDGSAAEGGAAVDPGHDPGT